jgi:hypothetical protein
MFGAHRCRPNFGCWKRISPDRAWRQTATVLFSCLVSCETGAASPPHAEMFDPSQKQSLTDMIKAASPDDATCTAQRQLRIGYGYEIANCKSASDTAKYRVAVSTEAILMDIEFLDLTPELVGGRLQDLQSHLTQFATLSQTYGFHLPTLTNCVTRAWDSYREHIKSSGRQEAEKIEFQQSQNVLTCLGSMNALWMYIVLIPK